MIRLGWTVLVVYITLMTHKDEQRIKKVKHCLIDKGLSFRKWCAENNVPHSVARDLVYALEKPSLLKKASWKGLDGKRKEVCHYRTCAAFR